MRRNLEAFVGFRHNPIEEVSRRKMTLDDSRGGGIVATGDGERNVGIGEDVRLRLEKRFNWLSWFVIGRVISSLELQSIEPHSRRWALSAKVRPDGNKNRRRSGNKGEFVTAPLDASANGFLLEMIGSFVDHHSDLHIICAGPDISRERQRLAGFYLQPSAICQQDVFDRLLGRSE